MIAIKFLNLARNILFSFIPLLNAKKCWSSSQEIRYLEDYLMADLHIY